MNIYSICKDCWPFKKLAINSFGEDPFSDVLKKERLTNREVMCQVNIWKFYLGLIWRVDGKKELLPGYSGSENVVTYIQNQKIYLQGVSYCLFLRTLATARIKEFSCPIYFLSLAYIVLDLSTTTTVKDSGKLIIIWIPFGGAEASLCNHCYHFSLTTSKYFPFTQIPPLVNIRQTWERTRLCGLVCPWL